MGNVRDVNWLLREVYDLDLGPATSEFAESWGDDPDAAIPIGAIAGTDSASGTLTARIVTRTDYISRAVASTCVENLAAVRSAVDHIKTWIHQRSPVRFVGAGRALLAATMPGNRLAHAGAVVSFMGGIVPMPSTAMGGGIIACSASGKAQAVLDAMQKARNLNPHITIIGLASREATQFRDLCDIFVGLVPRPREGIVVELTALADLEEYMIAELLDALIVAAGHELNFDDNSWRRGHEDLGPTGPYAPQP